MNEWSFNEWIAIIWGIILAPNIDYWKLMYPYFYNIHPPYNIE